MSIFYVQCIDLLQALLEHDLNLEAALHYLKSEAVKEGEEEEDDYSSQTKEDENGIVPQMEASQLPGNAPIKEEVAKKKRKKKLKGGVVVARVSD